MKKDDYYKTLAPIITAAGIKAKKKWQNFQRQEVNMKSRTEIVTAVDKLTEKIIIRSLKVTWPDHAFLGEESGHSQNNSDYLWIIDPIDGTTNFSIHNPLWCISVGLAYKNELIFGMIYAPVLEETFWAAKGQGAYLNGKRLRSPKKIGSGKNIHSFCHGVTAHDLRLALAYYRKQKMNSLDCRQLGSAAIELAYVAAGRLDSLVVPGARSWDVAAGVLIAQEAGAAISDFQSRSWNLKSRDLIACRPDLQASIVSQLKGLK